MLWPVIHKKEYLLHLVIGRQFTYLGSSTASGVMSGSTAFYEVFKVTEQNSIWSIKLVAKSAWFNCLLSSISSVSLILPIL